MDALIGLVGDGYVLMAADQQAARSILVFKSDQDKIVKLDDSKMMASAGAFADCINFQEYVQANMSLYAIDNGGRMSTHATANFVRTQLANALRSRGMYQTNILLGGYEEGKEDPALYYIDYLSAMQKMNFGAHGYGSSFVLSTLDREWREGMSLEEGLEVMQHCIEVLRQRFLIHMPKFMIKVVDKDGVRVHSTEA